ncbi:MAG: 50S ribosomal protein L11 methyltransferase [Paraclostridium sp.]|uniref:50S ribosomal protein L11 methyltransferase n=1 Tax=Paraclostridium sp. TaxID=2023273 RepID=UPI003AA66914
MKWAEITIKTTTEAVEAITNILYEQNVGGVSIEDPKDFKFQKKHDYDWDFVEEEIFNSGYDGVIIKTYITEERDVTDDINLIKEKIEGLKEFGIDVGEAIVELSQVDEEDWANEWKNYYKPTKIGEKIVVKPTWEEYEAADTDLIIELDPGMAFGTGTHETTSMCIRELEKYVKPESKVFDIGCGSGILGIAAAKLGAKDVLAVDLDEVAVKVSKENIELNKVEGSVRALHGNLMEVVTDKADIVVANIIADIIKLLAKDIKQFMKDDAIFISSGIIHAKVDEVKEALTENGLEIVHVESLGEWNAIVSKIAK